MSSITPPIAPQKHYEFEIHNDKITDNYFWLKDKNNPEVLEYLHSENEFTDSILKPHSQLKEQIFSELKSRVIEDDSTVPAKSDDYYYYSKTLKNYQYRVYCRKRLSLENKEEILLDTNELAKGQSYFSLGDFDVSPDDKLLAYSIDLDGSEIYSLRFKNLATGVLLSDEILNISDSSVWGNDNQTFYYIALDENLRPYRVYRHFLGESIDKDELLYEESDPQFFVSCSKSRDDKYIFIETEGSDTSEVYFLDAHNSKDHPKLIEKRKKSIEYSVTHHDGSFYILTNHKAVNFRVAKTSLLTPQKKYWKEFIPHNEKCLIEGMEEFKEFMVIYERSEGLEKARILSLKDLSSHYIAFDDPAYSISEANNYEFDTPIFRFAYTSLTKPTSVYDYDTRSQTKTLLKEEQIPGGYDSNLYKSERILAPSHDGTLIPISLVYRKDLKKDGTHPLYLYGYGAYGVSLSTYFSSNRLSLLDRGFVFAIAHVRGGSEMGRHWYEDGKLLKKKNTFYDFIACAEHLINENYTQKGNIAISGGSAGGMLIGTAINLRPELFKAALADVPFVDVINTMLDDSLLLTQTEYNEWGDPHDKDYYDYIKAYSPYDNVTHQAYPHLLITAGFNDPRVPYWEPAKWTAKLRSLKTTDHLLLLKTNMEAGHGGASGRYDFLEEIALEYTFILLAFQI